MSNIPEVFQKVITFLKRNDYEYIIIGGLAVAVHGYPRMTQDIDICISLKKNQIKNFLAGVEKEGFSYNKRDIKKQIKETGTFRIFFGDFGIDFIILSTDFERSAMKRKQVMQIYGVDAYFPTPEDLILFKIIPSRGIDITDIENIIIRYSKNLDKNYIINWAQKFSDESEDVRIVRDINKLLSFH